MKDEQVAKLVSEEEVRQKNSINLIASENFVSEDILRALGSVFVNKYAEGYPSVRYYGGNVVADKLENLCRERALKLFGLNEDEWAINVQPYSGSPANLAIYLALVPIGGKVMGMELSHGGHLTHGHRVSISGKCWVQVPYGVSMETEILDYDELKKIAEREKPELVVAGYTAYPRFVDWKKMREVADVAGAYLHVDMSHIAGLVAGGVHESPFPYADSVMTTTHKTLRGPRSAIIFSKKDEGEIWKKVDKAVFPGVQGGPHLNQIAAVAVALEEASKNEFKKYARQVVDNANAFSDKLKNLGWRLVTGGTDTHLILMDTVSGGVGGQEASDRLEKERIIVNKNAIPFDTRKPADPSGIRLGTAAETTRGKKEEDFIDIAISIDNVLRAR